MAYDTIRWKDFDRILVFDDEGELTGVYRPEELAAVIAARKLTRLSSAEIVAALRAQTPQISSARLLPPKRVVVAPPVGLIYPKGILPYADKATAERRGIFPQTTPVSCCFLAQTATLRLAKPLAARAAIFTIYVPDFSPFAGRNERVEMAFDGIPSGSAELSVGQNDARFAFPQPLLRETNVEALMTMSIAFVPKEIGLNDDPRRLSVILVQVSYK